MPQNAIGSPTQARGVKPAEDREEPLYRRIQAAMRARIAAGDWTPGQSLPGRVLMCEEFGTTRVTLDKAIQGLVAEGLLRSAKRVGTFVAGPGVTAGAGAPTRTPLRTLRMGVVVERNSVPPTDASAFGDNFYFGPLFQGVRDAVSGKAVDTVFAHLHRSEYLAFHRDAGLDGMILITPSLDEMPTLVQLLGEGVPYVAAGISSRDRSDADVPSVDTDNRQGARDAVRHLLALGHRRVAVINMATALANHQDRMEGYRQALTEAGLTVSAVDFVLLPTYDYIRFEGRVEEWLSQAVAEVRVPTAIFACDYLMTLATLRVLRRHGLRIPEDVSVVGFDDPLSAGHLTPALTTVRQPVYRMGRRAAERLLDGLQNGTAPRGPELLPTELIVRASTCPPRAAHSEQKEILL